MKKHYSLFALLTSAVMLAGAAFTGGTPKEVLRAEQTAVYTEFGYDVTGDAPVTGDWDIVAGTPAAACTGSKNYTINGVTYDHLKTLNVKNVSFEYTLPSTYNNVRSIDWSLHSITTSSDASKFCVQVLDDSSSILTTSSSYDLIKVTASGAYSTVATKIDTGSFNDRINATSAISKIRVVFDSGKTTTYLHDISISFENSNISDTTKLNVPEISITNELLTITRDEHSTAGYGVYLFYKDGLNYVEYGDEIIIPQPESGNAILDTTNLPQNTELFVKCRCLGDNLNYEPSDFTEFSDIGLINTNFSILTVAQFKALPNQLSDPWVYYEIDCNIKAFYDTSLKIIVEDGTTGDTGMNCFLTNYNDYEFAEDDRVVVRGYRFESALHGYVVTLEKDYIHQFEKVQTLSQLSFSYNENINETEFWSPISTDEELEIGGIYTITSGISGLISTMSTTSKSDNRAIETVNTRSDGTVDNVAKILKLKLGGNSTTGYTFETLNYEDVDSSGKYLATTSNTSASSLKVVKGLNDWCYFDIQFNDGGIADIKAHNKDLYNYIGYNGSSLFNCYSQSSKTRKNIYVYKQLTDTRTTYEITKNENDKNNISLRFGVEIPIDLKRNLDNIGVSEYGFAYMKAGQSEFTYKPLTGAYVNEFRDADAVEEANANVFQLFMSITKIPSNNFNVEVTAKPYVKVDNQYYFGISGCFSVNSLAKYYLDKYSENDAVKENKEVLEWLSTYLGD